MAGNIIYPGAGNIFVMVDGRRFPAPDRAQVRALCEAECTDGLIVLYDAAGFDFLMDFFNPDGSEAELCGNGARCVAAFAREIGAAKSDVMRFETLAGDVRAEVLNSQLVKVWMPDPKDLRDDFVNSGVPHKIVPVDDLASADVAGEGRRIRYSDEFAPAGTNVDFVAYRAPDRADIRTYERGVEAETGACGTGSVAAALVGVAQHGMSFPVTVHTAKGYELAIDGEFDGKAFRDVTLTGPVARVFDGEIDLDSLDSF